MSRMEVSRPPGVSSMITMSGLFFVRGILQAFPYEFRCDGIDGADEAHHEDLARSRPRFGNDGAVHGKKEDQYRQSE